MNTTDEMINLDDVIMETGDTDPFNQHSDIPEQGFIDLEAMAMQPAETPPDSNLAPNEPNETAANTDTPPAETQQALGKSLLDYILEMAMREPSGSEETNTPEPNAETETEPEQAIPETSQTSQQSTSPENLPSDVNQLLEEAKNIILNARITQYAQEQANIIRKEVNDLAALGIRITQNEIETIIQDALQKGIEPVEAFRSYAYRIIKIQSITGTPLRPKQTINQPAQPTATRTPTAPVYAAPTEGEFIPFEQVMLEMMGEE